jgi:hypothetical protein
MVVGGPNHETRTRLLSYTSRCFRSVDTSPEIHASGVGACLRRREVNWMAAYRATGDDLVNGYDFFEDETRRECILTNPPFSCAEGFATHAIDHSRITYLLLPLNFLASKTRIPFWKRNPLYTLFPLSNRPSFTDDGKTDFTDYAWFCWVQNQWSKPAHPKGIIHLD